MSRPINRPQIADWSLEEKAKFMSISLAFIRIWLGDAYSAGFLSKQEILEAMGFKARSPFYQYLKRVYGISFEGVNDAKY